MFQARRPMGRLFYFALAIMVATWCVRLAAREAASSMKAEKSTSSPEARQRMADPEPRAASPVPQSGPTLTSVIDATAKGLDMAGMLALALTKAYELKVCLTLISGSTDSADPNLTTLNDVWASLT